MIPSTPTDEQLSAWLTGNLDDPEAEQMTLRVESDPEVAARADAMADMLWRLAEAFHEPIAAAADVPLLAAADVPLLAAADVPPLAAADEPIAAAADVPPLAAAGAPLRGPVPPLRRRPVTPRAGGPGSRSRADRLLGVLAALVLLTAVSTVGIRAFREPPLSTPDDVDVTSEPAVQGASVPSARATPTPSASGAITPAPATPEGAAPGTDSTSSSSSPPPVGPNGDQAAGGQGGPSGPVTPQAPAPIPDPDAGPGPDSGADPTPGPDAGPEAEPAPPDPPTAQPSEADGSDGSDDTGSTEAGDAPPPSEAPADGSAEASPAPEGGAPVAALGAEGPTIADSQQPLADDDEARAYFGGRPESAEVAGLSGEAAEERAAANAQAVRDAGAFPSGERPDRCLDQALAGEGTAVVVAVETVTFADEPGLAYLVVRGVDELDHADVTIVGSGSCTPLSTVDVAL